MPYNEPGNSNELSDALRKKWIAEQNKLFNEGVDTARNEANPPSKRAWYFNPIKDAANTNIADIKWTAFPKRLQDKFASKIARFREGDKTRNNHEEYCEWEVVRDAANKVTRVTFSTEVPEYYTFLYKNDKKFLLDLYNKHVSPQVKLQDLEMLDQGKKVYNPRNIWNYPENQGKRGVLMHMGYGPNTLSAAIILAAEATWPSVDKQGNAITDEQGLIDCRGYGDRTRHSDPHIGAQINSLVRAGNEVSFDGPAGLYIDEIDLSDFEVPNGVKASDLFRVVRGNDKFMMRVVFEAPKDSGFVLGDIKVGGDKLNFGGQIAEKIRIRVRGIARKADKTPPSINCGGTAVLEMLEMAAEAPTHSRSTRKPSISFLSSEE